MKRVVSCLLALMLVFSSMSISAVTSSAASNEETETTIYYDNSFDSAADISYVDSKMTLEQVFNSEQTEGYLKITKNPDSDAGYVNLKDANGYLTADSKSMAVEFDVSSGTTEGVFKGRFRVQTPVDGTNKSLNLVYFNGTGVYADNTSWKNQENAIATIPTDGSYIKLGMLLNVDDNGKLTAVDIYQYDTENASWNKIGTMTDTYNVNFEPKKFQLYVDSAGDKEMLIDNLKVYRNVKTTTYYDNSFDSAVDLSYVNNNMTLEQVFNSDQTEGYLKITKNTANNTGAGYVNLKDANGYLTAESKSMAVEFDVSSGTTEGVFKGRFRVQTPVDGTNKSLNLVYFNGTGVYADNTSWKNQENPIATIPTDGSYIKLRMLLNVDDNGKLTAVDIYQYDTENASWNKIGTMTDAYNVNFEPTKFQIYADGANDEVMLIDNLKVYRTSIEFAADEDKDGEENTGREPLKSDFNIPTITPPEDTHPRVMFTAQDIPTIRQNLTHPENAEAYEMFTNSKNAVCDITDSSTIKEVLAAKAFDYVINYDENDPESDASKAALKNGRDAVSALKAYVQTDMGLPSDNYAIYNSGYILFVVAEVYDWCYPLLNDEDKELIVTKCEEMAASYLEIKYPPSGQSSVTSHGSECQLQRNLLALAIATYDEYPDIYNYVAGRYFDEYVPARNYLFESGGHWQGSTYGAKRYNSDLWSQILLCNMDKNDELEKIYVDEAAQVAYQWVYTRRPDSEILREGDDVFERYENISYINKTTDYTFFLASNFYGDGVLKAEFLKDATIAGGYECLTAVQMLALNDPSIVLEEGAELPLTKYISSPIGKMIARTGWNMGMESPDVLAYMNIGETQTKNHQHRDAGNFQIYYKGILASESGAYMNYNEDHDKYYNKSSIAHNTLSITSTANPTGEQITPTKYGNREYYTIKELWEDPDSASGVVIGQEFGPDKYTPEYTYIAGNIANAYDDNVKEAVRSMLFMPLKDEKHPAAFVVFDRITTEEANSTKTFMLHMQSEPTIDGNVTVIKNTEGYYNGMLTNQTLLPESASITKIGGEGQQFVVGGVNYEPTNRFNLAPIEEGWGRVEISTTTANQTDYMLNVMYVNDADQALALEEAELIDAELVVGAKIFDRIAMFNKALVDEESRIGGATEIAFTIPEDEAVTSYKVNVAGLQAGTWSIKVNGNVVDTQVATEEGGIIYFTAPAGVCTLTRTSEASDKLFTENQPSVDASIDLRLNERYVYTTVSPVKEGEELYLPVKALFDLLSSDVIGTADSVSISYLGYTIHVVSGNASVTAMDGTVLAETTDVKIVGGEYLIPASLLESAFVQHIAIEWSELASIIDVTADMIYDWSGTYPNAIEVKSIFAYPNEDCTPIFNAVDGTTATSWTHKGKGDGTAIEMGVFDLGQIYTLDEMLLAVYQGNNGQKLKFAVEVSTDNTNWVPAGTDRATDNTLLSSGTSTEFQSYDMGNVQARYVKIYGYDKIKTDGTLNVWNAITEIAFLGETVTTPVPTASPAPSEAPTATPTSAPTEAPTSAPTEAPTAKPTSAPTEAPTATPTVVPSEEPTATPEVPSEPTETPRVDATITEVKASEAVVEAVKEKVTISDSTATVDKTAVEAVVEATKENEPVVLPLTEVTTETVNKAEISAEALDAVVEKQADVVIEFSEITVKLDAEAVAAITEQAQGASIEIRAVKTDVSTLTEAQQATLESKETAIVVTAQVFSNGEYIGDFKDGKATVMLPFTPDADKEVEHYKVYYIDEAGVLKEVAAEYVSGYMVFTTPHFSDYVIVYEGTTEEDTTSTPAPKDEDESDDEEDDVVTDVDITINPESTVAAAPTGDNSNILLWSVLCLFALAVTAISIVRKKQNK